METILGISIQEFEKAISSLEEVLSLYQKAPAKSAEKKKPFEMLVFRDLDFVLNYRGKFL